MRLRRRKKDTFLQYKVVTLAVAAAFGSDAARAAQDKPRCHPKEQVFRSEAKQHGDCEGNQSAE